MNFTLSADNCLPNIKATQPHICVTRRRDWKHPAGRLPTASSEQSDAPERRSQANSWWTVNRPLPVIGDVRPAQRASVRHTDVRKSRVRPPTGDTRCLEQATARLRHAPRMNPLGLAAGRRSQRRFRPCESSASSAYKTAAAAPKWLAASVDVTYARQQNAFGRVGGGDRSRLSERCR